MTIDHIAFIFITNLYYRKSLLKIVKTMNNRPLSPHLTIYRPQLNSVLSILHRITGVALIISLLMVIGFFISLIFGEETLKFFQFFLILLLEKL